MEFQQDFRSRIIKFRIPSFHQRNHTLALQLLSGEAPLLATTGIFLKFLASPIGVASDAHAAIGIGKAQPLIQSQLILAVKVRLLSKS